MVLGDFDGKKGNNFTLIRLIFAWAVLFGHSFPITGTGSDPISGLMLPMAWIGSLAVGGFFVVSGFLVTASFQQRGAISYAASRIMRIYPAFLVCCLLTVLVVGPLGAHMPVLAYLKTDALQYFKNAYMWNFTAELPGIFPSNPQPASSNGSLWTLPAELRCYALVFAIGLLGSLKSRSSGNIALFAILYVSVEHYTDLPMFGEFPRFKEPLWFFIVGCLAWINRKNIPLNPWIALAALIAPILAGHFRSSLYFFILTTCLGYVTLFAAYKLPHVDIDRWLGDISYGVYIYAWPVQQLVWHKGQSGYENAALATLIVLPLAYLSWRLVEKPILGLRKKLLKKRATVPLIDAAPPPPASTVPMA